MSESIHNYAVVRQIAVAAPIENCWRFLTDRRLIADWFADVSGDIGAGPFEFHFGDGDYFQCRLTGMEPPASLRFAWQFMGAGIESEIEYALLPAAPESTLVTVIDRAERSEAGAREMCEGWDDFLARLERRIRTGENSRYRWTPEIGCGAAIAAPVDEARSALSASAPWSAFPTAAVSIGETDGALVATFGDPAWEGGTTEATLRFRQSAGGCRLTVTHSGFERLDEAARFDERKRYAGYWADLLRRVEAWSEAAVANASR